MTCIIKNIFISIGLGFIILQIQNAIGSKYVILFLKENLVTLLVALVAINSATLGIVLTKIRDLLDKNGNNGDFDKTKREMSLSIKEQIALIGISLILLLINDSKWLSNNTSATSFIEVIIIGCFCYALLILYDNAKSVFVILDYDKK